VAGVNLRRAARRCHASLRFSFHETCEGVSHPMNTDLRYHTRALRGGKATGSDVRAASPQVNAPTYGMMLYCSE
jgi:hypothetical protein